LGTQTKLTNLDMHMFSSECADQNRLDAVLSYCELDSIHECVLIKKKFSWILVQLRFRFHTRF